MQYPVAQQAWVQEFTKASCDENVFKERKKTTLFNKLMSRQACFVFCYVLGALAS